MSPKACCGAFYNLIYGIAYHDDVQRNDDDAWLGDSTRPDPRKLLLGPFALLLLPLARPEAMSTLKSKWTLLSNILLLACITPYIRAFPAHNVRQSSNISWFDCPDSPTTQCAFFETPMDYSNPNNNSTVSIFLRKLPAKVPADQRLGTILTNPGVSIRPNMCGPGGSGSAFVASGGEELSTIVEGRYDIIGFDPRGVNLTGPSTACFNVETKFLLREYQLRLQGAPFPLLDNTTQREHIRRLSALQAGHDDACERNGNQNVLESVGTVAVARDMAAITEALGEDGLNFWGYSYGTILGAIFAAIKPNLVKRMVLDGVSDSESYFNDILQWGRDGMQNTNKTLTGFLSTCIEAGPNFCTMAVSPIGTNETQTVETLQKRLDSLYSKLAQEPLIIADSRAAGSGFLKASDIQYLILSVLYNPTSWRTLADVLVQVERGNGANAYNALYGGFSQIIPRSYSELGRISPAGEQWALTVGGCREWSFRARERYTGPWSVKDGLKKTRYPVTPLPSAVKMSRAFGNESATLLVQQGIVILTYRTVTIIRANRIAHPSLCTARNIRDYFVSGKVPNNGTYCTPEPGYIYPNVNKTEERRSLSKRDEDLLGAISRLRDARTKTQFSGLDAATASTT
ncbi:alpha/beta hydrolase fold domain-containing protein [Rhizoctonia solani AG-1 IA]|uniref:Alpha/beta hydrolase fold domain-containing protein n=1 Tax=Thanatephorus cucumeris (strain AG1-IA) TaxID=983506 RepID=L8WUW6_THACA|nr:alpha/beta hydrolase fold domain-containing protein [Rhizoctonia solani AG-1 IA]